MFSTTIKRSAATLGVVAGLLAAAGPASAQALPGMVGVTNRDSAGHSVAGQSEVLYETVTVKAPKETETASGRQPTITDIIMLQAPTNAGTQVGSEGVKAPSTEQVFDNTPMDEVVFYATSNRTGPGEVGSVWNNGDGNDTAKAEGTQVGSEGVMNGNAGDDTLIY